MNYGELIALLTTFCWSIGIFPFTEASRRLGTAALNQYRLLLAWLIITCFLIIFNGLSFPQLFTQPGYKNYLYLGLSGILGFTLGDFFSFTSFTILGPKLGSLYTTIAPGAALVAAYFILGESVNYIGIIGIAVTILGVIWLTLSKKDKMHAESRGFIRNRKGIIYGILGACGQGTGLVFSKLGLEELIEGEKIATLHAVWIRLMAAFLTSFIVSALIGKLVSNSRPVFQNKDGGLKFMFIGTLFGPVAGVSLSLLAISLIPVAVAQTIFALLPVMVLPISYFVYKEKATLRSLLACTVSILGVLILIWRESLLLFLAGLTL
ncbi:MAG: DMT family transporter [Bacteroidia bacterium]